MPEDPGEMTCGLINFCSERYANESFSVLCSYSQSPLFPGGGEILLHPRETVQMIRDTICSSLQFNEEPFKVMSIMKLK